VTPAEPAAPALPAPLSSGSRPQPTAATQRSDRQTRTEASMIVTRRKVRASVFTWPRELEASESRSRAAEDREVCDRNVSGATRTADPRERPVLDPREWFATTRRLQNGEPTDPGVSASHRRWNVSGNTATDVSLMSSPCRVDERGASDPLLVPYFGPRARRVQDDPPQGGTGDGRRAGAVARTCEDRRSGGVERRGRCPARHFHGAAAAGARRSMRFPSIPWP